VNALRARRVCVFALAVCALAVPLGERYAFAQSEANAAEYQIKAAYVFKFLNYVDWPGQTAADAPLQIGVIGARAMADELTDIVARRTVNGRPVLVRRLRPGDTTAKLNLLFVAHSENARLAGLVAAARDQGTLLVTESAEAPALGSAINFVVEDDKVRFDVAPHAFEKANLKVSARLLTVARRVLPGPS
jgi:hypothetical protein